MSRPIATLLLLTTVLLLGLFWTLARAQTGITFFPGPGMTSTGGGGGGCTGTINLTTGCVQPMLGGL